MIYLDEATKDWKREGDWRIAPAGLSWIAEGAYLIVGSGCSLGSGCKLGNYCSLGSRCKLGSDCSLGSGCKLGNYCSDSIDLGFADGYRKCIAQVKGVAYIGAGCRWFTLAEALKHWSARGESRALTMCLMQSAVAIAGYKGWSHE